jgi:dihydroorotate dehydrogenase
MAYDFAVQERAEELYVLNGLTHEDVAADVDVSVRTIANWAKEGRWTQKRKEFRSASADIKRYATLTRLNLIKKAMRSTDPQAVYAFAALERATNAGTLPDVPPVESPEVPTAREIRTPEDAVNALQEAVESKLNMMLCNPAETKLSGIKDIKKALEMIGDMKTTYATEAPPEIDEDTREQDRTKLIDEVNRILGVK